MRIEKSGPNPAQSQCEFNAHSVWPGLKWGIKVFILSDATNGYVHRLQVYTGKNSELSQHEQGPSTRVVLELLQGIEGAQLRCIWITTTPLPVFFSLVRQEGRCMRYDRN